jgi:hypothetical protein
MGSRLAGFISPVFFIAQHFDVRICAITSRYKSSSNTAFAAFIDWQLILSRTFSMLVFFSCTQVGPEYIFSWFQLHNPQAFTDYNPNTVLGSCTSGLRCKRIFTSATAIDRWKSEGRFVLTFVNSFSIYLSLVVTSVLIRNMEALPVAHAPAQDEAENPTSLPG